MNSLAARTEADHRYSDNKPGKKLGKLTLGWLLICFARGLAFFLATYCLISIIAYLLGASYNRNIWWIDLSALPAFIAFFAQFVLCLTLYAFVLRIPQKRCNRYLGCFFCLFFALHSLFNTAAVYATAANGLITLGFPLPFSLFIALAFIYLVIVFVRGARLVKPDQQRPSSLTTVTGVILSVLLLGVLFPVGQILCFGTTVYKGKTDAVVVLGAQVLPNKVPSDVLQDRLDTAIAFYQAGNAPVLIMSGGVDIGGNNEAEAMRDYALSKGVPNNDIIIDSYGDNTQATALNATAIMRECDFKSIAAVSNYYHMARIKMLFLSAGCDVMTVPSVDAKAPYASPLTVLREVPGWWYYWFATLKS